jgi:hypothetical protein
MSEQKQRVTPDSTIIPPRRDGSFVQDWSVGRKVDSKYYAKAEELMSEWRDGNIPLDFEMFLTKDDQNLISTGDSLPPNKKQIIKRKYIDHYEDLDREKLEDPARIANTITELGTVYREVVDNINIDKTTYNETQRERKKTANALDVQRNVKYLKRAFPDLTDQQIEKYSNGDMDYDDTYAYLSSNGNHKAELDWVDFFSSAHPGEDGVTKLPMIGTPFVIYNLHQLQQSIERIDTIDGYEEAYTDVTKKDIARVINYLDAQSRDRSVGNQVLSALSHMIGLIGFRYSGQSAPLTATGKRANQVFSKKMKDSLIKATSKGFTDKLSKFAKGASLDSRVARGVAKELKVATSLKGTPLMTYAEAEKMKTADMSIFLKADINDKEFGYPLLYNLDFKDPKDSYNYLLSAGGSTLINGMSERFGSFLKALPIDPKKTLGRIINGGLIRSYVKANPKANPSKVVEVMDKANIDSILSEVLEERVAGLAIGGLGVDQVGQEISPGFRLKNEEGELEFAFLDLVKPTMEEFIVELTTIGVGSATRQASQYYANQSAMSNMIASISNNKGEIKIASEDLIKIFANNKDRMPSPMDAILWRTAEYNKKLNGKRSIKWLPSKTTDPKYIKKLRERGSEMITKDLVDFLENNPELADISYGWYGDNYTQAKEELSNGPLPELKDPESEMYFSFLVALTSPQSDPELNTKKAIQAFIKSERNRSDFPTGLSKSQQKTVENYNKIKDHLGSHSEVAKFLTTKINAKDLEKKLWEYGVLDKVGTGQFKEMSDSETVYASEFLGPKVGAFYLNLMGIEDIATIDLWMYRALSTALGEPVTNINYSKLIKLYEKSVKDGKKFNINDIKIPKYKKDGSRAMDKGKPAFESLKLIESAGGRSRLKLYRQVVEQIQQDFNKATGKDWTVAQVQAGIWYMEKHIFTKNNVTGSKVGTSDYLSVAESIVDLGEVYDEKTRRTIRTAKDASIERSAETRRSELSRSSLPQKIPDDGGAGDQEEIGQEEPGDGISGSVSENNDEGTPEVESDISSSDVRGSKLGLKKQIDKDALNKKAPNLLYKEVPEVVILDNETQASTFLENLIAFKDKHLWGGAVSLHSLEYYTKGTTDDDGNIYGKPLLLQSYDGKAGSAIVPITNKKTGETVIDIQSVFNTKKSDDKEAFFSGTEMMRKSVIEAIKMQKRMGADKITLDCYDGYLPNFYKSFGFVISTQSEGDNKGQPAIFPFNDDFAEPDFPYENYKKFMPEFPDGRPPIVEMEWDPKKSLSEDNSLYVNRLALEGDARVEEESTSGYLRRKIQDRLSRLNDYKSAFEKSTGRQILEDEDFATEAMLAPNKAINKINQILDSLVNRQGTGFYQRMAKDGVTEEDLNLYLHALHTRERNTLVEKRTEGNGAIGSGLNVKGELMTNEKADEIIKYYETIADGKPGAVIDYAREFKINYIERAVQVMEQGGLISRETANIFLNRNVGTKEERDQLEKDGVAIFSNYITLNVDMEADHTLGGMDLNGGNGGTKGFGLNGPEGFAIKGSKNDLQRLNPVQQTIESLVQKVTRAENNQVNMKLLNAMRAVDFKTEVNGELVNAVDVQERDPDDGTAYNDELGHRVYTNTKSLADNQILAKEDGVEYIITINDKALANGIKNISPMGTNVVVDALNTAGNFTKMFITAYNPSFWIGNFQADLFGGVLNLSTQEGLDMSAEVARTSFGAVMGIFKQSRDPNDNTNDWAVYYDRMKSAGGKVSFYNPKDYEDRFKDLDKRMRNLDSKGKEKRILTSVVNYIGDVNDAIEGGIRLATFKSAVDRGYSDAESAKMAREVTIDFNKKGEWGRWIEAGYRFANVGVQGVYRTGKAFKDDPKMAGAIGTGLVTTAMVLAEFNAEWDEEEWEDISDFEKDNYMFLPNLVTGKGFFRWRQPYGWGVFQTMGTVGSEMRKEYTKLREGEEVNKSYYLGRMLDAIGHNFVPIPTNQVPTLPLQIAQGLKTGEDAIGRKFRPHKYNPQSSNLENYYPNTPEWAKTFAYGISNLPFPGNPNIPTGNYNPKTQQIEWKPQGLDISPNDVEFLFGQIFGGVFTDVNSIIKMTKDGVPTDAYKRLVSNKTATDWTKVPMVRKLLRYNPNRDIDQSRFFRLSRKSQKEPLQIYELQTLQRAMDNLYNDSKVDLKEYNKMWDRVYNNQADDLRINDKVRVKIRDKMSGKVKNPNYDGFKIPGIKSRPKYLGDKRGDLTETLDALKVEKERRKSKK